VTEFTPDSDTPESPPPESLPSESPRPLLAKDPIAEFIQTLFKQRSSQSQTSSKPRERKKMARWQVFLIWVIVAIVVLIALLFAFANVITEYFWTEQLGYGDVFVKRFLYPALFFLAGFIVAGAIAGLFSLLAFIKRPVYRESSVPLVSRAIIPIQKYHKIWLTVIAVVGGLFVGALWAVNWSDILLMFYGESFGYTDPQFQLDAGFYVFTLPGLEILITGIVNALWFTLLANCLIHYAFGALRFRNRKLIISRNAKIQISTIIVLLAIVSGISIFCQRFSTLTQNGERITGAAYTQTHASIPANTVLSGLVILIGIAIAIGIFSGKLRLIIGAAAAYIVFGAVGNMLLPMIVQRFVVDPNAQNLEAPYIERNIEATNYGFDIGDVETIEYNAKTEASAEEVRKDADTTMQIRLLDPQVVSPTFRQIQQNKQYYNFIDTLSVDKYVINGESRDTVIAAREINLDGNDQRNWVNDHTVFTHGYGLVAAYGNQVTTDGNPLFFEKDIPTVGDLTDEYGYEPRIYFSPNAPEYSIVGNSGTGNWEFDFPSESSGDGAVTTFSANGGPSVNNPFLQLLYAIRFGSDQIIFSERVNAESQILFYRDPSVRVQKVAPYLTLDGRVYPAVVDGRIVWIVDAYTTSDSFPYSQMVDLGDVTQDSLTTISNSNRSLNSYAANYIRNSVKATVDAYDGSVKLYAWDSEDPILKAWSNIFPTSIRPLSEISSQLMSHMRYPESLFKIQRSLIAKYHVTDSSQFFSGEDFWKLPNDPTKGTTAAGSDLSQPPYYLTLQMPTDQSPIFSLSTCFIPGGESTREILTGFLAVSSDAGSVAGVIGENYGKLRLLELPKNSTVPGPGQAQNNFNSNAAVSQALNLLQTGSSEITRGNLLTLPIAGGLVYVQPVYVQSSGNTSFPLMKKVLVSFGDSIGFADTLAEAMDQVFKADSTNTGGSTPTPTPTPTPEPSPTVSPTPSPTSSLTPDQLIAQIRELYEQANQALTNNDLESYGRIQREISELLQQNP
jgi:uncharacterized membrane protein (UPF0182 family)